MLKVSIKRNVSKLSTDIQVEYFTKNFVNACEEMNVVYLSSLLSDDIVVNDQSKWEFLSRVRDQFNYFRSTGNTSLKFEYRKCCFCSKSRGCDVHFFKGRGDYEFIAFYFDIKEGKLNDIVICNEPSGTIRSAPFEKMFNIK